MNNKLTNSFEVLFELIKSFGNKHKSKIISIIALIGLFIIITLLSNLLTKISYTQFLDITDPNNIVDVQPITNNDQRAWGLLTLIIVFITSASIIGRWQGFASIISLVLSGFTIYKLIIPLLLNGWNPLIVTFFAGVLILSGSIFFSHGINVKTSTALSGGILTLLIAVIIGEFFRRFIQVSGYYGDTAYNLLINTGRNFDMGGIVLSSIILSGVGLLDDITITQTSVTSELFATNPKMKVKELYKRAMNVGRDHIGALVNSLFWAYAAASLPLLMLLQFISPTFDNFITYEFIMDEILRTLISSSALVLSVPITTFLAAYYIVKRGVVSKDTPTHSHIH